MYTPSEAEGCDHRQESVAAVEFTPAGGPELDMAHLFAEQPQRTPDGE
jgi:hypothetical protein